MTESMVRDFVKDLLNSIRERGIDTKAAFTVFIGGGAKLLCHFLEQSDRLGKYTFIEDISANAKGYDRMFQLRITAFRNLETNSFSNFEVKDERI